MTTNNEIYICSPYRTAIGSFLGSLATTPATKLASLVLKKIIEESGLPPEAINEVILGSVLTANQGQAPARQAALGAGLPQSVQAMAINKVCSSGLKAVMLAATSIQAGASRSVLAGGMENMSLAPYLLPSGRSGARLGNSEILDSIIRDGLWDPYKNYHMGSAAELCSRERKIDREAQDTYAIESYKRALSAIESGAFKNEILPVEVSLGRDTIVFDTDEEPGKAKLDKIPGLRPVFEKEGTVTAANASSINDGAAAMLICSKDFVDEHKLKPRARILSQGWHGQAPEWFTTAPVGAVQNALAKASLSIDQIDLFELNEAFSVVALACAGELEIDPAKLNVNGGAVALGHPIGASGARILVTLINALEARNGRYGAVGICNGGGEATSLVIERL